MCLGSGILKKIIYEKQTKLIPVRITEVKRWIWGRQLWIEVPMIVVYGLWV